MGQHRAERISPGSRCGRAPVRPGLNLYNSSFAAVAAHSVPAIATMPEEGFEEGIAHDETVYGIPAQDEDALVEAMVLLYEDDELRQRLARGVDALAARYFNWDACVAAIRAGLRL